MVDLLTNHLPKYNVYRFCPIAIPLFPLSVPVCLPSLFPFYVTPQHAVSYQQSIVFNASMKQRYYIRTTIQH